MAHGNLAGVTSVVAVDWPTKDVPDSAGHVGARAVWLHSARTADGGGSGDRFRSMNAIPQPVALNRP